MRVVHRFGLLAWFLFLVGCVPHFGTVRVSPEKAFELRRVSHQDRFEVVGEGGCVLVGPDSRLRIQTQSGWSDWISAADLRADGNGLYLRAAIPVSSIGLIRIEQPSIDLVYALQNFCHERGCFADLEVFSKEGNAPEIVSPLYSTCVSADEQTLAIDSGGRLSRFLPSLRGFSSQECGLLRGPPHPELVQRVCKAAQVCPERPWLVRESHGRTMSWGNVSAIELRDDSPGGGLGEIAAHFIEIGSRLRAGRWGFFPRDPSPTSVFLVEHKRDLSQMPSIVTHSFRTLVFDFRSNPVRDYVLTSVRGGDAITHVRIDGPADRLLEVIRGMCAVVKSSGMPRICELPTLVFSSTAPVNRTTLVEFARARAADTASGHVGAVKVESLELTIPSEDLLRELISSALITYQRFADRWTVYSRAPGPMTTFDAAAGQLPSGDLDALRYVQTASVPWDSIVLLEFQRFSAFPGCSRREYQ